MGERFHPVQMCNMCMITDGDRVLTENRSRNWTGVCFPGGHVEPGESIVASVIREIREETGLEIRNPKLCGIQDFPMGADSRYLVFYFKSTEFSGELRESEEGEVKWISLSELMQQDFADGFEEMLKVFLDDSITELYHPRERVTGEGIYL